MSNPIIKTTVILFIILSCHLPAFCQVNLNTEQVTQDYRVLKNILTQGYPSLYKYSTQTAWDSIFRDFENEKLRTINNDTDLYKSLTELTNHARDGHLIVMRPQLTSIPRLFPLLVKVINGNFYTDTGDFGIPVGSEIISINGVNTSELRDTLLKYAPSDGYNTSKKDRQLESEFSILHFYEYGALDDYEVAFRTASNKLFKKTIESQSFESIGKRFSHRNSYFAKYHNTSEKADFAKNRIGKKEPFVYYIDSLDTAVLTMNSFQLDVDRFKSELKVIFKTFNRKNIKNLIIDIRQNEGGYPLNSINAFSYIARAPFKQIKSSSVVTSKLPEEQYSKNLVNGYTYKTFFEEYYQNATKIGNAWVITTDENESKMVPSKNGFKGTSYVLIGGKTFSAGSSFALYCKNQGITLVGEETGGGYYTQNGGYPVVYTLPNSKIKILISFVNVNRFVKDYTIKKGSGILPDVEIPLTIKDLIEGTDNKLDYVLRKINKK